MASYSSKTLLGMHLISLTTTIHANIFYQSYRVDCEPLCQKIQQFSGYCPTYGSCQWYCHEKKTNCTPGTSYHCARDLHFEEAFVVACAQETFCRAGEEPRISLDRTSSIVIQAKASVFCRPCFKRDRFNGSFNTSSATFSECPSVKTNLCTTKERKIDCGYVSYKELTKTDGYCRCDARNGYAAQTEEMCFYENKRCFRKDCPDGEELLLNYTCARFCPDGLTRMMISDNCQHITLSPVFSLFTTRDLNETVSNILNTTAHISTESTTGKPPYVQVVPNTLMVACLAALIGILLIGTIVYFAYKHIKGKRSSKRISDSENFEMQSFIFKTRKDTEMDETTHGRGIKTSSETTVLVAPQASTSKIEQSNATDSHTDLASDCASTEPSSSKSISKEYFGQELCEDVYEYMTQQKTLGQDRCWKIIQDSHSFDFEYLKSCSIRKPEPNIFQCLKAFNKVCVPGYVAYGCLGAESTDLYEWISRLVCGYDSMKYVIRLAAARYAELNAQTYAAKLTEEFGKGNHTEDNANLFFGIHNIDFAQIRKDATLPESVSQAFKILVRDIVTIGKGTGPFHVEFLCAVLNCRIIQHFENFDQDVSMIPGIRVTLPSSIPSDRELHIYWLKSKQNPIEYHVFPLFKTDDTIAEARACVLTHPEKFSSECYLGIDLCASVYTCLTEENRTMSDCLKMIDDSSIFAFESLKTQCIMKPDPHFFRIQTSADVPGYELYSNLGDETMSPYEWISLLLFGDVGMQYVIRLAAARYALKHFNKHVKQLTEVIGRSASDDARRFFKVNGIKYKEHKNLSIKECVSRAFTNLVRETVNIKRGNGPFYVEFLCGVLKRTIIQHFEGDRYYGQDVRTIPGLSVKLTSHSGHELHFYWRKTFCKCPHMYCMVPLFKTDESDTTSVKKSTEVVSMQPNTELEIYQEFCEYIIRKEQFLWQNSLERIDASMLFDFDKLKHRALNSKYTYFVQINNKIKETGYTAYDKPGDEPPCLYEWISHLMYGDGIMKYTIRLAAARFALQNFEACVTWLTDVFNEHKEPVKEAVFFFQIHNIAFEKKGDSTTKTAVSLALADLVREIVHAGSGNGPFFVKFLSGALNCTIIQHYEDGRYYDREVNRTPSLLITLANSFSSERELHIYWMKSGNNSSKTYRTLRLLKNEPTKTPSFFKRIKQRVTTASF